MNRLSFGEIPRPSSPDELQLFGDSIEAPGTPQSVETVVSYNISPFSDRNSHHSQSSGYRTPSWTSSQDYNYLPPATPIHFVEGLGTDENDKVQPAQLRNDRRRLRKQLRKNSSSEEQERFDEELSVSLTDSWSTTSTWDQQEYESLNGGEYDVRFEDDGSPPLLTVPFGNTQRPHSPTPSQLFSMTEGVNYGKRAMTLDEQLRAMNKSQVEISKHLEQTEKAKAQLEQTKLRLEDQIEYHELSQHELGQRYSAQKAQLDPLKVEEKTWERKYVEQQRAYEKLQGSMLKVSKERDSLLKNVVKVQAKVSGLKHSLKIAEAESASADRIAELAADNERLLAELEEATANPPSNNAAEQSRLVSQLLAATENTEQDERQWMLEVKEHFGQVEARRSQLLARMLSATRDTAEDEKEWLRDGCEAWLNSAGAVDEHLELAATGNVPFDHPAAAANALNLCSATEYSWVTPGLDIQRPLSAPTGILRSVTTKELHLHVPRAIPRSEQMRRIVGQFERQSVTFDADTAELLAPDHVGDVSVWEVTEPTQIQPNTQMKESSLSSVSIESELTRMEQTSDPSQLSMRRTLWRDGPLSELKLRIRTDSMDESLNVISDRLGHPAPWEKLRPNSANEVLSRPLVTHGCAVPGFASIPGSPLPSESRDSLLASQDSDFTVGLPLGWGTTSSQLSGQSRLRSLSEINSRHEGALERQWLARHRRIQRSESHRTTATHDQQSEPNDTSSHDSRVSISSSLSWNPGSEEPLNGAVPSMSSNAGIREHQQWQEQERNRQNRIRTERNQNRQQNTMPFTFHTVPGWRINPETTDAPLPGSTGGFARSTEDSLVGNSSVPKFVVNEPSTASNSTFSISSSTPPVKDHYWEHLSDTTVARVNGRGSDFGTLSSGSGLGHDSGYGSITASSLEKSAAISPHSIPPKEASRGLLTIRHTMNSKASSSSHDQESDSEDKASIWSRYSQPPTSISSLASSVRSMQTFFDSSNTRFRAKVLKFLDGLPNEITTPTNSKSKNEATPDTAQAVKPRPRIIRLPSMLRIQSNEQIVSKSLSPILEVDSEDAKSHRTQMTTVATKDFKNGADAAGLTVTETGAAFILKEKVHSIPDLESGIRKVPENDAWAILPAAMNPEYERGRPTVACQSSDGTEAIPSANNSAVLSTGRPASRAIPSEQNLTVTSSFESSTPSSNASQFRRSKGSISDSMVLVHQSPLSLADKTPQLTLDIVPESSSLLSQPQMLSPSHLAGSLRWHFPGFKASRDGKLWSMDFSNFRQTQHEAGELRSSDSLLVNDGHIVTLVEEEGSGSTTDDSLHDWSSTSSSSSHWEVIPYPEIQDYLLARFGKLWLDEDTEHGDENSKDRSLPADYDMASITTEGNDLVSAICDVRWQPCNSTSRVSALASVVLFISILATLNWMQMWFDGNDKIYWNADTEMQCKYVWAIPWLERLKYQLIEYIGGSELIHEVYGM